MEFKMLKEISNRVGSVFPIVSAACFAAGLFAGRKIGLAAGCKIVAEITKRFGQNAEEWNQAGDHYWAQAKKDAYRDLTAVGGFAALGFASGYAGHALLHEEQEKPGVLEYYGTPVLKVLDRVSTTVLNTLYDYKKPILATTLTATAAVGGAAIKFPVQRNNIAIWLLNKYSQCHQNSIQRHLREMNGAKTTIESLQQQNQKIQGSFIS